MNLEMAVDFLRNTLYLCLLLAAPVLIVSVGVGIVVSILQSVTSIQEQTLVFIPKLILVSLTLVGLAHWILRLLMQFCTLHLQQIAKMGP